jgi:hypothetical protein
VEAYRAFRRQRNPGGKVAEEMPSDWTAKSTEYKWAERVAAYDEFELDRVRKAHVAMVKKTQEPQLAAMAHAFQQKVMQAHDIKRKNLEDPQEHTSPLQDHRQAAHASRPTDRGRGRAKTSGPDKDVQDALDSASAEVNNYDNQPSSRR